MGSILYLLYLFGVFVFSIILHEVAHGIMALRFGDTTARNAGRLTLNPIPHIDPVGSIVVPGVLLLISLVLTGGFIIAWAKPVPVNPLQFNRFRVGTFWVSAAGVFTNGSIAVILGLVLRFFSNDTSTWLFALLFPWVFANIALGLFNLLPIPPLDGSKIASALCGLSFDQQIALERTILKYWFFLLFGMLLMLPFIFPVIIAAFTLLTGHSFPS